MNKQEFNQALDNIRADIQALKDKEKALRKAYEAELLERNGYHLGDTVVNGKGKECAVVVGVYWCVNPYLDCRKLKKDGSISKIRGCFLDLPLTEI